MSEFQGFVDFYDHPGIDGINPIRSRTQEIPSYMRDPHYTDRRFTQSQGGRTVYLASGLVVASRFGSETVDGAHYNYSDRISEHYGYDKVQECWRAAKEQVGRDTVTAELYEAWLQRVYEDPATVLQHIVAGVNAATGYSYRVFGTVSGTGQQA